MSTREELIKYLQMHIDERELIIEGQKNMLGDETAEKAFGKDNIENQIKFNTMSLDKYKKWVKWVEKARIPITT